mmetsp:Transcript_100812/g.325392  ORF Transcript_100812/g.325392 Transcript_100812/m.325392 type:complete len:224 (+) Transcript_100812:1093-1764(+)
MARPWVWEAICVLACGTVVLDIDPPLGPQSCFGNVQEPHQIGGVQATRELSAAQLRAEVVEAALQQPLDSVLNGLRVGLLVSRGRRQQGQGVLLLQHQGDVGADLKATVVCGLHKQLHPGLALRTELETGLATAGVHLWPQRHLAVAQQHPLHVVLFLRQHPVQEGLPCRQRLCPPRAIMDATAGVIAIQEVRELQWMLRVVVRATDLPARRLLNVQGGQWPW